MTVEQLSNSAVNNADLAMAHIRSGLCLSALERGGMLDDKARTILNGIIRQCSEALAADAMRNVIQAERENAHVHA